jgi:hypothetical protein
MKKSAFRFACFAVALLLWPVQSYADWVKTNGPYGGTIRKGME